jgi:hypothetical protein
MARMIELPKVDPCIVAIIGARGVLNPPEQWDSWNDTGSA